ncbi:hypothetical protein EON65_48855 [archaeon]|nr:MAG: hypothetical protein EON65_48855 [archaeon]
MRYLCAYFFSGVYDQCRLESIVRKMQEEEERGEGGGSPSTPHLTLRSYLPPSVLSSSDWSDSFIEALDILSAHRKILSTHGSTNNSSTVHEQLLLAHRYELLLRAVQHKVRVRYTEYNWGYIGGGLLSMCVALYCIWVGTSGVNWWVGIRVWPIESEGVSVICMMGLGILHVLGPFSDNCVKLEHVICFFGHLVLLLLPIVQGYAVARQEYGTRSIATHLVCLIYSVVAMVLYSEDTISSTAMCIITVCVFLLAVAAFNSFHTRLGLDASASRALASVALASKIAAMVMKGMYAEHTPWMNQMYLLVVGAQCTVMLVVLVRYAVGRIGALQCRTMMLLQLYVLANVFTLEYKHILVIDIYLSILSLVSMSRKHTTHSKDESYQTHSVLYTTLLCAFSSRCMFFLTNHHTQFSKLHLAVAFIGTEQFIYAYAGAALLLNTFATDLLVMLLISVHCRDSPRHLLSYRLILTFTSSLAVCILCRHLMLPAVFAPKV